MPVPWNTPPRTVVPAPPAEPVVPSPIPLWTYWTKNRRMYEAVSYVGDLIVLEDISTEHKCPFSADEILESFAPVRRTAPDSFAA